MAVWPTRAASAADLDALRLLLTDSCEAALVPSSALLTDAIGRGLVRVLESGGELAGCIAAEMPSPEHVRIAVIAVRAGSRRQGMAKQLLTDLVQDMPQKSGGPPLISALARTDQLAVTRTLLATDFKGTRVIRADGTGGTLIDFAVDFAFKSRLFEMLAGQMFDKALRKMIGAFEARAIALYGVSAETGSGSSSPGISRSSANSAA